MENTVEGSRLSARRCSKIKACGVFLTGARSRTAVVQVRGAIP